VLQPTFWCHDQPTNRNEPLEVLLDFSVCLRKMISDNIIHHNDVEDMATELVESKKYSFQLELKLVRLETQLEERLMQSKHEIAIISQELATDGHINGQPITEKPIVPTISFHKLPTLTLPTFCGDVREWKRSGTATNAPCTLTPAYQTCRYLHICVR